jgi:hypothetical protein
MTSDLPDQKQLAKELQILCATVGYRAGTNGTEAIKEVPTLIGLAIVGGPSMPDGILEWRDRRDGLREVLKDVIENEVKKELDERYADAAIRIFRLNFSRPLDSPEHAALKKIQAPLDETFGSLPGSKAFQDDHRPLIFAVMARALQARERRAKEASPGMREQPAQGKKTPKKVSTAKSRQKPAPSNPRRTRAKATTKKASKPPPPGQQRPADGSSTSIGLGKRAAMAKRAAVDSPASPNTKNWTRLPDGAHEVAEAIVVLLVAVLVLHLVGVLPE